MTKPTFEELVDTIKEEVDRLKKYLLVNPINKDKIEELQLDSRFYDVTYTQLVEKDKIYITDKEGYDKLFGPMHYVSYNTHINDG